MCRSQLDELAAETVATMTAYHQFSEITLALLAAMSLFLISTRTRRNRFQICLGLMFLKKNSIATKGRVFSDESTGSDEALGFKPAATEVALLLIKKVFDVILQLPAVR